MRKLTIFITILIFLVTMSIVKAENPTNARCTITFDRTTALRCLCPGESGQISNCPIDADHGWDLCSTLDNGMGLEVNGVMEANTCSYDYSDIPFLHSFTCAARLNVNENVCESLANSLRDKIGVYNVRYTYQGSSCNPTLSESDNGFDIYTFGSVDNFTSSCDYNSVRDQCIDLYTLKEAFIFNDEGIPEIKTVNVTCPDGYVCEYGRCIPACRLDFVSIDGVFVYEHNITGYFRVVGDHCDLPDTLQIDINDTETNGQECHLEYDSSKSTDGVSGLTIHINNAELINESGRSKLYRFSFNSSFLPEECIGKYLMPVATGLWQGNPGEGKAYSFLIRNVVNSKPFINVTTILQQQAVEK